MAKTEIIEYLITSLDGETIYDICNDISKAESRALSLANNRKLHLLIYFRKSEEEHLKSKISDDIILTQKTTTEYIKCEITSRGIRRYM